MRSSILALALVLAACIQGRLVCGVDGAAVGCFEADRDAVSDRGGLLVDRTEDPELRPPARRAVTHGIRVFHVTHQTERLQQRIVEGLGSTYVVAADRHVAEHRTSSPRKPVSVRMTEPQGGASRNDRAA